MIVFVIVAIPCKSHPLRAVEFKGFWSEELLQRPSAGKPSITLNFWSCLRFGEVDDTYLATFRQRKHQHSMSPDKHNDSNPFASDAGNHSDNGSDANAQDQILLEALAGFFVPLVQKVMDPMEMRAMDFKGPEAMNLITALKKFVSTVVGRSVHVEKAPRKIQIEKNDTTTKLAYFINHNVGNNINIWFSEELPPPLSWSSSDKQVSGYCKRLLNGLQEHVSNKMLIRLLLIEPHSSHLQNSLIDRGAIYAHLANIVKATPIESLYLQDVHEEHIDWTIKSYAKYAILSHKWLRGTPGEITYNHWNKGLLNPESAGY
ncbi:hypothetical protein BDN70DRAFT_898684 [Pholiota conissans]|uniref:Uncharacterized protein n=1 Tax=Pholiota conissans TaxID=109636 RepID=A0A9P5YS12_9AGAR|nr:hypothetical protein BDN70DRAFT_898684 [Pholiota conissans]